MTSITSRFHNRSDELFYFIFFITHIVLSVTFDFQAILPTMLYPNLLLNLHRWYINLTNDPLMSVPPLWFQSLIVTELFFHMPFFIYASKCLWQGNLPHLQHVGRKSFYYPIGLTYTVQVMTTMIPVFFEILFAPHNLSMLEKIVLMGVYSPFFVIPATLYKKIVNEISFSIIEKKRRE